VTVTNSTNINNNNYLSPKIIERKAKKTAMYGVGNTGPGNSLKQSQKLGGVKSVI
jgi:hypothetical protein